MLVAKTKQTIFFHEVKQGGCKIDKVDISPGRLFQVIEVQGDDVLCALQDNCLLILPKRKLEFYKCEKTN